MWRKTPYDDEAEEKRIEMEIHNAYERGFKAGLQAQADCNTCDKAVRDRVGVIGCAKFDSKPTVAIPSAEPCEDAISRQALLKLMGEEPFNWTDSDKELQEVEDYRNFRNMVEQLPSVNPQEPKWIPVSERLPEWDIECLVVDDKGEFGVGFYRDDVGAWDSPSWGWLERKDDVDNHDAYYMPCGIGKIVAWMPLPKPYEPQERSNDETDN